MIPKSLSLLSFIATATATTSSASSDSSSERTPNELPRRIDLEVNRNLLENAYPAFKTFKGDMHAGVIPAVLSNNDDSSNSKDYSSYMFWLLQPDVNETDDTFHSDTLVIWLNGGSGCSSFFGMLAENSPVTISKSPNSASVASAPLQENPFAWTKRTAMLFVEQPSGPGFSTASKARTGKEAEQRIENDVGENFYAFFQNLYTIFGEELASKKVYITGESAAGIYIPAIARSFHLGNKRLETNPSSSLHFIDIHGIAIGNGWIDVDIQVPTSIDYAWWHHMIDLPTRRVLHRKWNECITGMITDSSTEPFHSFTTPDECGIMTAILEASGSSFAYDVTTYDAYPAADTGMTDTFFNNKDVQKALNVDEDNWRQCVPGSDRRRLKKDDPYERMRQLILLDQDRRSALPLIAELLDDAKIDVLVYNGDLDLACNSQGTELALEAMDWSGNEKWRDPQVTKWYNWIAAGNAAGHSKRFNNLEFLVVYNSGRFVPINQAEHALDMIGRLLDGKSFSDVELPRFDIDSRSFKPAEKNLHSYTSSTVEAYWSPIGLVGFFIGTIISYVILTLLPKYRRTRGYERLRSVPIHYN